MTTTTTTVIDTVGLPVPAGTVNGPEDLIDWEAVEWRHQNEQVRRLRQRIFKATRDRDWKKVRNLQKLMLRSRANTLVSVHRVTQRSTGRRTSGIDGQIALTPHARADLAARLHAAPPGKALPVRRVYIPKKGGKQRPIGIPVIADRAQQQRVRNALEPEWEARLDQKQYGFRPGRGCHDAIEMVHRVLAAPNAKREWIIDADLASAFDRIDHTFLMNRIGSFPAREQIRQWLKAGVVDKGRFTPTEEGTPQGGVISPLLLNIALQGLEEAAGVEYDYRGMVKAGCPTVITYADDFVALCHSRQQAQAVQAKIDLWLAARGLTLNKEKTTVRHVDDGFDFLSFTIRRYHPKGGGTKVLTRPSKEALARIRRGNADTLRSLRGSNVAAVIQVMNPRIRGQANYFRNGASKEAYQSLDDHLWQLIYKWLRHRHPGRSWKWLVHRYFGPFNPDRNDRWILGDRTSGAYLHRYAWTPIVRHAPVPGRNSPDDPDLARYWADRRRRRTPPQLAKSRLVALRAQRGNCPLCGLPLLFDSDIPDSPRQWEHWYAAVGTAMTSTVITDSDSRTKHRLVHTSCARRHGDGTQPARTSRTGTRPPQRRA